MVSPSADRTLNTVVYMVLTSICWHVLLCISGIDLSTTCVLMIGTAQLLTPRTSTIDMLPESSPLQRALASM